MTEPAPDQSPDTPNLLDGRALSDLLGGAVEDIEKIGSREEEFVGSPTGFDDLDALLGGLRPGNLYALIGPSGVGTSTLALDLARFASIKHGLTSLMLSSQSPAKEIIFRLLAAEARVAHHALRGGLMNDVDWTRFARRLGEISEAPLFIDDTTNLTIKAVQERAQEAKFAHDLRLLVIDGIEAYGDGRNQPGLVSAQVKKMALELDVPIVLTLSACEAKSRDLIIRAATSSSWAQSADVMVGIHRPDLTDLESPRAGEADLMVVKHRNGPTGTVTVAFQGHYSRFVNMTTG